MYWFAHPHHKLGNQFHFCPTLTTFLFNCVTAIPIHHSGRAFWSNILCAVKEWAAKRYVASSVLSGLDRESHTVSFRFDSIRFDQKQNQFCPLSLVSMTVHKNKYDFFCRLERDEEEEDEKKNKSLCRFWTERHAISAYLFLIKCIISLSYCVYIVFFSLLFLHSFLSIDSLCIMCTIMYLSPLYNYITTFFSQSKDIKCALNFTHISVRIRMNFMGQLTWPYRMYRSIIGISPFFVP